MRCCPWLEALGAPEARSSSRHQTKEISPTCFLPLIRLLCLAQSYETHSCRQQLDKKAVRRRLALWRSRTAGVTLATSCAERARVAHIQTRAILVGSSGDEQCWLSPGQSGHPHSAGMPLVSLEQLMCMLTFVSAPCVAMSYTTSGSASQRQSS